MKLIIANLRRSLVSSETAFSVSKVSGPTQSTSSQDVDIVGAMCAPRLGQHDGRRVMLQGIDVGAKPRQFSRGNNRLDDLGISYPGGMTHWSAVCQVAHH